MSPRDVLTKAEDIAGRGAARPKQHLRASPIRMAEVSAAGLPQSRNAVICKFCSHVACKHHIDPCDVQM